MRETYFIALLSILFALNCGGNSTPTSPTNAGNPPTTQTPTPTITITSEGVSPKVLAVAVGERVRIVNNDSRTRQLQSNPHPLHSDCQALNEPGSLSAGSIGLTGVLTEARACHYHDHATDNRDARFRGQIVVGSAQPTEPPPTPSDDY